MLVLAQYGLAKHSTSWTE